MVGGDLLGLCWVLAFWVNGDCCMIQLEIEGWSDQAVTGIVILKKGEPAHIWGI
jgi:hypothetical protein